MSYDDLVDRMYCRALVAALFVLTLGALGVIGAPEAQASTGCVWTMADVDNRSAGSKECTSWSGVKRIADNGDSWSACASTGSRVVLRGPWANYCGTTQYAYTTTEPAVTGGALGTKSRAIADSMRALGAKHGVTVQLARVDNLDRLGCPSGASWWLASTYTGSGGYSTPGEGLIRVGVTSNPGSCLKYWNQGWNAVRHELAHALIERTCGTTAPPIMQGRVEPVTGAYSALFLGNTDDTESGADKWRARKIYEGRCS
jgi:hypothetical protein